MSNRLLGILILTGFILSGILFYMYFFVYYNGTITLNSNVPDYKVEIYSQKLLKTSSFSCPEKKCVLQSISPVLYSIKITKDSYNTHEENISISRSDNFDLVIKLVKKVILKKQEYEVPTKILSNKEKIDSLRKNKAFRSSFIENHYATFDLKNLGEFIFDNKQGKLILSHEKDDLGTFETVPKDELFLKEIYGDNRQIFIRVGEEKFLYNLVTQSLKKIDLNLDIIYVKSGNNNYLFVTDKGTFVYDLVDSSLEYFSLFRDFVYFGDYYIGVIGLSETRVLKNLGFEDIKENLVVSYNPSTKEKKILYKTPINLNKIINDSGKILLIDDNGERYMLENFD